MRQAFFRATIIGLIIVTSATALPGRPSANELVHSGLQRARDLNPAPDIVEVRLVATETRVRFRHGRRTVAYTYNGVTPGPLIEGKVGDRLIVHLYNRLPERTSIHWHGVETPAAMDGSNISQEGVPPGGYFRYEFELLTAATFWYHPHFATSQQVEKGLYGPLIVRAPDETAVLGLPSRELTLMVDDIRLGDDNQIVPALPADPLERAENLLNGREGNIFLVNGRKNRSIRVREEQPYRLRVINAANSRFMRLSIPEHTLWRIGGDAGYLDGAIEIPPIRTVPDPDNPDILISDPHPDAGVLLAPGERAELVFIPMAGRRTIPLEWHDVARGRHAVFYKDDGTIGIGDAPDDGKRPPVEILRFRVVRNLEAVEHFDPDTPLRESVAIDAAGADPIPVRFGHMPPDDQGNVMFFATMVDGRPRPFPMLSAEEAPTATVGQTRIWEVVNMTGGDHPFHAHGFFFQPLEIQHVDEAEPKNNRTVAFERVENKDTIIVPRRPGAKGTSRTILRAAVRFDDIGREGLVEAFGKEPTDDSSGGWVFHCHVLEHSGAGMMSFLNVRYPEPAAAAR